MQNQLPPLVVATRTRGGRLARAGTARGYRYRDGIAAHRAAPTNGHTSPQWPACSKLQELRTVNQGNRVPARRVVRIAAKVDLGKRARQSRGWTNIATGHVNALHARFRQFPFAIRAIMHANHGFSTYEKHGPDVVHRYEPHGAGQLKRRCVPIYAMARELNRKFN